MNRAVAAIVAAAAVWAVVGCASKPPTPSPAEGLFYRGVQEWSRGNYAGAWTLYRRAYDQALLYADLKEQGVALINLSELSLRAMRYSVADSLLSAVPSEALRDSATVAQREVVRRKIAAATERCGEVSDRGEVAGGWGARLALAAALCEIETDNLSGARQKVDRAAELFGKGETGRGQTASLRGAIAFAAGDFSEAVRFFEEGLEAAQAGRQPYAIGEMLYSLGAASEAGGDSERAAREYDRAMKLFDRVGVKIPYLKAAQGWLRTSSSVSDGQKKEFETLLQLHAGPDLDRALSRKRF